MQSESKGYGDQRGVKGGQGALQAGHRLRRGVLACVSLGWKGSEMQLQTLNPAPHAHSPSALPSLFPPLNSHLQSLVSTPWGFWVLGKGVLASCRDKKAQG